MPLVQTARKTLPWAFGMALSEDLLSLSDEELLALSLKKPSTFEILMTRYQRQFLTRAQNVLGSRDSAEDVVQEAFIRIYRFAPKFRGEEGTFRAWSLTILMNVARTHYRKGARTRQVITPLEPEHYESLPDASAKEAVYAKDEITRILGKVPEETANIIRLAYLDDIPYKDIARELGISVAAVKTRVHRAKQTLREVMSTLQ